MSPEVWLGAIALLFAVSIATDLPLCVVGHPYGSRSAKRTAPHQRASGTDRREPSPPPAGPPLQRARIGDQHRLQTGSPRGSNPRARAPRRKREWPLIAAGVTLTLAAVLGMWAASARWAAEAQAELDAVSQEDQP